MLHWPLTTTLFWGVFHLGGLAAWEPSVSGLKAWCLTRGLKLLLFPRSSLGFVWDNDYFSSLLKHMNSLCLVPLRTVVYKVTECRGWKHGLQKKKKKAWLANRVPVGMFPPPSKCPLAQWGPPAELSWVTREAVPAMLLQRDCMWYGCDLG